MPKNSLNIDNNFFIEEEEIEVIHVNPTTTIRIEEGDKLDMYTSGVLHEEYN